MAKDPYTVEQLIRLVKASGEDSNVDAKAPMAWDEGVASAELSKDIAAFANSRDGGTLVIGKSELDDGQFDYVGLTAEQAKSFDPTRVANWLESRFKPPISIRCHIVEYESKRYAVIDVSEFSDIPILCVRNFDSPTERGKQIIKERTLYVRNSKAESAPLGSPDELRELIGMATGKNADRMFATFQAMLKGKALFAPPSDEEQFASYLTTVKSAVEGEIKDQLANGGWCMSFHPSSFRPKRFPDDAQLESLVAKHAVRVQDEFPANRNGTVGFNWGIGNSHYGESWGFSRAGAFVWCEPFRENYYDYKPKWQPTTGERYPDIPAGQFINFKQNLFKLVDFFAFLSRIVSEFDPEESITYHLTAGPLSKRRLITSGDELLFRNQFAQEARENLFDLKATIAIQEFHAAWKDDCALAAKRFFDLFPGERIGVRGLRLWVDKYLARDFGD